MTLWGHMRSTAKQTHLLQTRIYLLRHIISVNTRDIQIGIFKKKNPVPGHKALYIH